MSTPASAPDRPAPALVREQVEAILCEHLDRRTSAMAVKIAARTWLRVEPEAVTRDQLGPLCNGLEPMLRTLLGPETAAALLERISRELAPARVAVAAAR